MAALHAYDLQLRGGICDLSARIPEMSWSALPAGASWIVRGVPQGSRADPRVRPLPPLPKGSLLLSDSAAGALLLHQPVRSERELYERLGRWKALPVPPLTWQGGRLHLRVIVQRPPPSEEWRRAFPDAQLILKRPLEAEGLARLFPASSVFSAGLTDRQSQVLREAVRQGYYEVPRSITVRDIARSLGLGRSTVEEHLRAAESTVVRSVAPLLELRGDPNGSGDPTFEGIERFARYSAELGLYVQMALAGDRIVRVELTRERATEFPERDHPYLTRVLDHARTGEGDLRDLPVELRTGPFERRALEEIRRIPPGEVATYREIARRMGRPRAVRAVGNACARNPTVIVIPCHRVVPTGGGVGNYSSGLGAGTKSDLLEREGVTLPPDDRPGRRKGRVRRS